MSRHCLPKTYSSIYEYTCIIHIRHGIYPAGQEKFSDTAGQITGPSTCSPLIDFWRIKDIHRLNQFYITHFGQAVSGWPGKGKWSSPYNRPQRPREGVEVSIYSFFNLCARWGWVVSITPQPLHPRERPGTHCSGGWLGPRAGLDRWEKSRPHGDSIPGPSSP
jgi:hypothetical protein